MSHPSGQSVPVATARTATLLAFAVNGVNFASWASRIPEVKQKLDLSAGDLGTVLLAVSVGSLIALPLSGRIAQALGVSRALFANDWLAVAFVEGHGLPHWGGVLALAVFLTSMTAGRVLGTGLLDRHGRVPVLRALLALAAVGCLLVVFGNATLAFVGAVLWGLGASMGFPVGISAAADDPRGAAQRISVVSTIGYTAFLAGPPLLGWLGDHRCAERPARGGRDAGGRLLRDAGGGPQRALRRG